MPFSTLILIASLSWREPPAQLTLLGDHVVGVPIRVVLSVPINLIRNVEDPDLHLVLTYQGQQRRQQLDMGLSVEAETWRFEGQEDVLVWYEAPSPYKPRTQGDLWVYELDLYELFGVLVDDSYELNVIHDQRSIASVVFTLKVEPDRSIPGVIELLKQERLTFSARDALYWLTNVPEWRPESLSADILAARIEELEARWRKGELVYIPKTFD